VEAIKALLRAFSYLFHAGLGLFLLGVAALALITGPNVLQLKMLPWSGATLSYVLLCGAILSLISVVLAFTGKIRVLFLLWSLAVAVLLLKGYVFSSYRFGPAGGTGLAVELLVASWFAVAGAWFVTRKPVADRY